MSASFERAYAVSKKHQKVKPVNNLSTADLEQIVRDGEMGDSTPSTGNNEVGAIFWRILQILATPRYRL